MRLPADAVRKDARGQHSRGAHHCMCAVFLLADAVRKDTRAVTAISGTLAHAASVRRQPGQLATVQHQPRLPAAVAFQFESNQTENGNIHQ